MKNLQIVLFILFPLIYGCSLQTETSLDLSGEWIWVQTYGGFAGITMTPESEGYSQKLIFKSTSSYSIVREGEVIRQGKYRFNTIEIGGSSRDVIVFEPNSWETFITLSKDTLFLDPNCMDCFHDIYIKKP